MSRVANPPVVDRAVAFYRDVIGLHVAQYDAQSAFLAAGEYHHHVALNTWDPDVKTPPAHTAGLHHFAFAIHTLLREPARLAHLRERAITSVREQVDWDRFLARIETALGRSVRRYRGMVSNRAAFSKCGAHG